MAVKEGVRRKQLSFGIECASYGCSERSYVLVNGERKPSGTNFFKFPVEKNEKNVWCNLIKRHDGKDGFNVRSSTRVCMKHFPSESTYRPPGGTRRRLLKGARPTLHTWNNFGSEVEARRKAPAIRLSPRKRCRVSYSEPVNFEIERKGNM